MAKKNNEPYVLTATASDQHNKRIMYENQYDP
jgi:hypothetical protein